MRNVKSSILARQPWVTYDTVGYQVMVRHNGVEWGVALPEEPARRAYRATLDVRIPHPGSSEFPWWRR